MKSIPDVSCDDLKTWEQTVDILRERVQDMDDYILGATLTANPTSLGIGRLVSVGQRTRLDFFWQTPDTQENALEAANNTTGAR